MMKFFCFLLDIWPLLIFPTILISGFIYRRITKQPFKGNVPPMGVFDDLPSSVTGMNKYKDRL